MQVIPTLHSLVPLIAAIPSSIRHTRSDKFTPLPPSISTLQQEPGRRLSKYASLYFPNISGYINDTERWAAETKSNFSVIVVPAIDRDVAATVSSSSTSVYTKMKKLMGETRSNSRISTIYRSLQSTKVMVVRQDCPRPTMGLRYTSVR